MFKIREFDTLTEYNFLTSSVAKSVFLFSRSYNFQPFFNAVPSVNSIPTTVVPENNFRFGSTAAVVTTAAAPSSSSEELATARVSEVTNEPSATPTADPQPTSPSQEEVTAGGPATEAATVDEAPAAVEQSQPSNSATEGSELSADDQPATQTNESAEPTPAVTEEQVREEKPAAQEVDSQLTGSVAVVVEPVPETSSPVNDSTESSTASGSDSSTVGKSEEAVKENLTENKPTESGANGKSFL